MFINVYRLSMFINVLDRATPTSTTMSARRHLSGSAISWDRTLPACSELVAPKFGFLSAPRTPRPAIDILAQMLHYGQSSKTGRYYDLKEPGHAPSRSQATILA
jgi:hypothetical protein